MIPKKKKATEGAPAYMAQYTSLMTILLAFFICLQTIGMQRESQYKQDGIGSVKNLMGQMGGHGMMAFIRAMKRGNPTVPGEKVNRRAPNADLLGYLKGAFSSASLDAAGLLGYEVRDPGYSVRIVSPVDFIGETSEMTPQSKRFVDRLGSILYSLPGFSTTVCCYRSTGDEPADIEVAARRAAAVVHQLERKGVASDQLTGVGYAHKRYIGLPVSAVQTDATVILIGRKSPRVQSPDRQKQGE